MKTMSEWEFCGCGFREFAKPGDEIDAEIYHYFLGCVPPLNFNHGFQCGEPISHRDGEALYSTFTFFYERYRYVGEFTKLEAQVIGRFLNNVL